MNPTERTESDGPNGGRRVSRHAKACAHPLRPARLSSAESSAAYAVQQLRIGLRSRRALPYVALAALLVVVAQVTLGGVVRVTDSGLGCPDWPLCDGRIIPVFERAPLVEFSHRVVGSVVGLLALAVAVLAMRHHRSERIVLLPSLVGALLVLAAALLGAVVVWTELAWWVRLIHLGLAQGVVACMVVVTLATWPAAVGAAPEAGRSTRPKALAHAAVAGTFLVILSGSYMVGYGASASCDTWPLCRGSLMPEGTAYAVHMGHRLLSALAGVAAIAAAVAALRRGAPAAVRSTAWLVIASMVGQTLLGAWTVWADFTVAMRAAHLGGATLLWAAVVGLAALHSLPGAPAPGQAPPERAGGAAS